MCSIAFHHFVQESIFDVDHSFIWKNNNMHSLWIGRPMQEIQTYCTKNAIKTFCYAGFKLG